MPLKAIWRCAAVTQKQSTVISHINVSNDFRTTTKSSVVSHIEVTIPLDLYLCLIMKPFTVLQFCCKEFASFTLAF